MVFLVETPDDFGVGVGGSVGVFLFGEGDQEAGVIVADGRELIILFAAGDFDAGPFGPEVDAGGGFDEIGDVGAADAGGGFEEIEAAVVARDEFGVGDAEVQAEGGEDIAIEGEQVLFEG